MSKTWFSATRRSLLVVLLALFVFLSLKPQLTYAAIFTVTNSLDAGANSLREAVNNANLTFGADLIQFDPAGAPYSIPLLSMLLLSDGAGVTIDGWSAGGVGYSGPPLVEINGTGIVGTSAILMNSSNNVVHGMVFNRMAINVTAIRITGPTVTNNWVYGNYIGTDTTGTAQLQNQQDGIIISAGATNNLIGTNSDGVNDTAERNIISGNRFQGIHIQAASNNRVSGNYIGTNVTGTVAICNGCTGLLNGGDGILLDFAATNNIIGTNGDGINDAVEGNIISGTVMSNNAVFIRDSGTNNNRISGNLIGTNAAGTGALPNGGGISIAYGASNNIIGTNGDNVSDALERNIISGNTFHGIQILESGTNGNHIAGNYIGTSITGNAILGNGARGIEINTGPQPGGPTGNFIGENADSSAGEINEGNLISGNSGDGVSIFGTGTDANILRGNFIGTNAAGTAALRNIGAGVRIFAGVTNTGVSTGARRSVISGNQQQGIIVADRTTTGTLLLINFIGTDVTGTLAVPNQSDGVLVFVAGNTRLDANTINFNFGNGVLISGSSPTLDVNETSSNQRSGIRVEAYYGASSSPATAADDIISLPAIGGVANTNNCTTGAAGCAGIFLLDSTANNAATLEIANPIGTNNGANDIEQRWYGALEIISGGVPIASAAVINSSGGGPNYNMGSSAACAGVLNNTIIHGTAALSCANVQTWTQFTEFIVNPAGVRATHIPQTIAAPPTTYSYDANAATNPTNSGAGFNAEGITTGAFSRYQVMETTLPDPLPTVISTTPTNGAIGVAANTTIAINFSENVTVTGAWFTVNCTTSGAHTGTVTGGAQNYVITPTVPFTTGETCTVTVVATQVADQDLPIGNMAADYVFNFTVADAPPTVVSTTPANGTTGNAANTNVTITFSEPVNVVGGWFDITCSLSGNHAATVTGTSPIASYVLDPAVNFTFGETCTVTITAANVTDNDAPMANMAADYVFTFGVADAPPFVASTTPLNGATGVAINSNITVNFSENVALGGAWYTITCATSGAHIATPSGTGANFALDPTTDFAFGELCTVTVVATQVQDIDVPLENMAADYVFTFTTLDTPPTVASTAPSSGMINVPVNSDITINFSENVTVTPTWFTITCTLSGAHTGVVTGGAQNYVINPDTDLFAGESCTVTVYASQIVDQDGVASNMAANYVFNFNTVNAPGYGSTPVSAGGTLNFGDLLVGQSSTLALTIIEVGTADLDVTAVNITNPSFSIISITPAVPFTIVDNSGGTIVVTIACTPMSIGAQSGTLNVTHNAAGGVANYTLACNGIVAPPTSAPAQSSSGQGLSVFDPAISKIGFLQPGQVGVTGERIEWVITVSNPTSVTGTNVVFSDTLRPELRVESVDTSKGTSNINGQTVTVNIGTLAAGETVQISIFTRVLRGTEIDNTACVRADNLNGERCATGLMVSTLPQTGETPLNGLIWVAGVCLICLMMTRWVMKKWSVR
jgi:methionine-rich copper-binding protein CopC